MNSPNAEPALVNLLLLAVDTLAVAGHSDEAKYLLQSLIFRATNDVGFSLSREPVHSSSLVDDAFAPVWNKAPLLFQAFGDNTKVIVILHYIHLLAFDRPALSAVRLMQHPMPISIAWEQLVRQGVTEERKVEVCVTVCARTRVVVYSLDHFVHVLTHGDCYMVANGQLRMRLNAALGLFNSAQQCMPLCLSLISMANCLFKHPTASNVCRQLLLKNRSAFELWEALATLEQVGRCTLRSLSLSTSRFAYGRYLCLFQKHGSHREALVIYQRAVAYAPYANLLASISQRRYSLAVNSVGVCLAWGLGHLRWSTAMQRISQESSFHMKRSTR